MLSSSTKISEISRNLTISDSIQNYYYPYFTPDYTINSPTIIRFQSTAKRRLDNKQTAKCKICRCQLKCIFPNSENEILSDQNKVGGGKATTTPPMITTSLFTAFIYCSVHSLRIQHNSPTESAFIIQQYKVCKHM